MLRRRVATGLAFLLVATPAFGEAKINGNLKSADLELQDCPITEVLDALVRRFDFHYRSKIDLTGSVSGRYEGSVLQIVHRLLPGYSFVIKSGSDGIDLTVIGLETPQANEPESPRHRRRDADRAVQ